MRETLPGIRGRFNGGPAISEDLCPTWTRAKNAPFAGPVLDSGPATENSRLAC